MHMKKKGNFLGRTAAAAILMACMLLCSATEVVFAADNHVETIDISVMIRDDGSAVITQRWQGTFEEGTENYIPIRTGDIGISGLTVSDEDGAYAFVEDWDIDWKFKEKAGKCGIVETDEGVELCFGISEYGSKVYDITYVVTDFIKGYTDYNGTNFMFINPDMSTFPTAGRIEIRMENGTALNDSNAGVWGFGFEGQAGFDGEGAVTAYTEKDLDGRSRMIVMLQLDKGLLSPKTTINKSFEEVKERAMEDSDYGHGEDDTADKIMLIFLGVVVSLGLIAAIIAIIYEAKRKKAIKEFSEDIRYFTDIPNHGMMDVTHYLARSFDVSKEDDLILGALLLSMMNERYIDLRTVMDDRGEETAVIELLREPEELMRHRMYHILAAAAEGTGSLEQKVWEDYAFEEFEKLNDFVKDIKEQGEDRFTKLGGFMDDEGNCIKDLSETGKVELSQVIGLKKYLEENVRMADKDLMEANLWQEYMVYAVLLGVADQVIEQLKLLYPEQIPVFDHYYYHRYHHCHAYYHCMNESIQKAEAERAAGSGGSSSIGGGGGFSGGGSGGGSR